MLMAVNQIHSTVIAIGLRHRIVALRSSGRDVWYVELVCCSCRCLDRLFIVCSRIGVRFYLYAETAIVPCTSHVHELICT